ncbi:unnamed protein product [Brassica oleracea]|uniref:(rape) hypothetical protein n=1 Tax=Brassica napus TaxID=3708 RepID=A0A816J234_BRANA|nr:unnamed protein product [Brassica napus]
MNAAAAFRKDGDLPLLRKALVVPGLVVIENLILLVIWNLETVLTKVFEPSSVGTVRSCPNGLDLDRDEQLSFRAQLKCLSRACAFDRGSLSQAQCPRAA